MVLVAENVFQKLLSANCLPKYRNYYSAGTEPVMINKPKLKIIIKKRYTCYGADIGNYSLQKAIAGERSRYSKTDTDASAMHMKNEEILPAYNAMASAENQFIAACILLQNPSDGTCFKTCLE